MAITEAPTITEVVFTGSSAVTATISEPKDETLHPTVSIQKTDDVGGCSFDIDIPIFKVDDAEQLVGGIVYEPDIIDKQGDSAGPVEIRKAAHGFMLNSSTLGVMHKSICGDRARIVETYVAPVDFQFGSQRIRKGTWVMLVKVLDKELWGDVKAGKITGFSMGGRARCDTTRVA